MAKNALSTRLFGVYFLAVEKMNSLFEANFVTIEDAKGRLLSRSDLS